jgi:hypothetical protein
LCRPIITPSYKTVTFAGPQLCSGRIDFEKFNYLRTCHPPVTDTVVGPIHQYTITKLVNTGFDFTIL